MGNVAVRDRIKNYLTRDDIRALRDATSVSFFYGKPGICLPKNGHISTYHKVNKYGVTTEIEAKVRVSTFIIDCDEKTPEDFLLGVAERINANHNLASAMGDTVWKTITSNLKENDRICLEWGRNTLNSPFTEENNIAVDTLHLKIIRELKKETKRFAYLLAAQPAEIGTTHRLVWYGDDMENTTESELVSKVCH